MAVELKLVIEKDKGRVAFAESDNRFVDTIFSFLTTPVGTVVRLSSKSSNLGCMDMLYESVENLDYPYWETTDVKEMLLRPRCVFEPGSTGVALCIDPEPPKYYRCGRCGWDIGVKKASCSCGGSLWPVEGGLSQKNAEDSERGVFVEGNLRFVVGDDLSVVPISTAVGLSCLRKLGIRNCTDIDIKTVDVGVQEAFHLLKRALVSRTPLTDVFVQKPGSSDELAAVNRNPISVGGAAEGKHSTNMMKVKLMVSKSKNKVLYAEASADFADLLFSFLTFPLGTIIKLLGSGSSFYGLGNVYKSVKDLSDNETCIVSEKCSAILLDPKLALHWQCENQLLPVMEEELLERTWIVNPKRRGRIRERGGGFVRGPKTTFMITDGLVVKPLSVVEGISIMEGFNVPFEDLQERVVNVGVKKALSLLKASLCSKTVLTDVFCRQKLQPSKIDLEP